MDAGTVVATTALVVAVAIHGGAVAALHRGRLDAPSTPTPEPEPPPPGAHRFDGLNYLGGFPGAERPVDGCALVVTETEVSVENGEGPVARLPMHRVTSLTVDSEEEARQRLVAGRVLAVGIIACAIPRKTKGSVLLSVNTDAGPLLLEAVGDSKAELLCRVGPAMALVQQHSLAASPEPGRQMTSASVTDEIRKLGELREAGLIDDTEFDTLKKRLIG